MTEFKTATGKALKTDYIVPHDPSNSLYIRVIDSDMATVTKILSDSEETAVLTYGNKVYEGYTMLMNAEQQSGAIKVRLEKP